MNLSNITNDKSPASNGMIQITDLKKEYTEEDAPTRALRGVTFSIAKGEFVSIMGPSGSGKSTLLQLLSFLDRPTGGTYTFQGKSIDDMTDHELAHVRNKDMGFVFQSFNLLSRLSVYDNVEIPLLYSDVLPAKRRTLVEEAVRSVGLEEKLYSEAGKLSGGQKQRVAIARALVTEPNVIFADEPTGNLDSQSGLQIMEILKSLHDKGRTVILVTHETQTAEFANRIILMKDGMVESDRPITARNVRGTLK
jgi:putative ABC transport system ATP-binding protein